MSSPYESSRRRRGVWSHWVPLVLTVTVATVGVAAWVWSLRKDDDHEDAELAAAEADLDYENADYGDNPPYGASRDSKSPAVGGGATQPRSGDATAAPYAPAQSQAESTATGWAALRRTPSPQQFFDSAKRTVAAGVTAAGAAVGSALAAIREEDKTIYEDHEKWSEEADAKREKDVAASSQRSRDTNKRRKKVAIVVSADSRLDHVDADGFHEHASILSHIPRQTDFAKIKLYVLIYAPNLKDSALDATSNLPPASLSSSFSNIDHAQAQTPADEAKSPLLTSGAPSDSDRAYNAVYAQAQGLVEKDSMILTFTTPNGHAHILRHIQPELIYLQESLAGDNGSVVENLQHWHRQDIVLVVGAEEGHGGLADSDDSEVERGGDGGKDGKWKKKAKGDGEGEVWWHREERVGRGRGVIVVDGMRVQDDWARRVMGKE